MRLWKQEVRDHATVRDGCGTAKQAQWKGATVHMIILPGLCAQQGSDLPDGGDAEPPDGPVHGGEHGGDLHGDAGRRVEEHAVGRRGNHQAQQLPREGFKIMENFFGLKNCSVTDIKINFLLMRCSS